MKLRISNSGWRCRCRSENGIPLSGPSVPGRDGGHLHGLPEVGQVQEDILPRYLAEIGFTDPSVGIVGMDDSAHSCQLPLDRSCWRFPRNPWWVSFTSRFSSSTFRIALASRQIAL